MKKQSIWGAGPIIVGPGYITLALIAIYTNPSPLFNSDIVRYLVSSFIGIIGIVFIVLGAYNITKAKQSGTLITSGIYSLTRNPLYCGHIFFLIPAIALFLNNVYGLFSILLSYILFKILIVKEEIFLQSVFGDQYEEYCKSVNQLFPFPRKLTKQK